MFQNCDVFLIGEGGCLSLCLSENKDMIFLVIHLALTLDHVSKLLF
jgi:hypothetical protein